MCGNVHEGNQVCVVMCMREIRCACVVMYIGIRCVW